MANVSNLSFVVRATVAARSAFAHDERSNESRSHADVEPQHSL
jgi:hypothetical protein